VCDTSPCLSQIKSQISEPALRFALYEPVEFIRHFLVDKLEFNKVRPSPAASEGSASGLHKPGLRGPVQRPPALHSLALSALVPPHTHTPCAQVRDTVAVHVPCSSKKMGIEESFVKLAGLCANEVVPSGIPCCGMAGDRGMRYPELTGASLQHLNLPAGCSDGYSTSRTCEMSLSNHSGVNFRGIVYLVDEATRAKQPAAAAQ
jgi:D-lactate dehydrogenase